MTLEMKLQSFIVAGKLRDAPDALLSNRLFEYVIKLKDEKFIHGLGDTRFEAQKNATEEAIEYALDQGWITNTPEQFSFSTALDLLKQNNKITRKGWNGADQWLSISCPDTKDVVADNFWSPHNAEFARQNGGSAKVAPCITLKNAQGLIIMGWIPSAGDLFAYDWMIAQ